MVVVEVGFTGSDKVNSSARKKRGFCFVGSCPRAGLQALGRQPTRDVETRLADFVASLPWGLQIGHAGRGETPETRRLFAIVRDGSRAGRSLLCAASHGPAGHSRRNACERDPAAHHYVTMSPSRQVNRRDDSQLSTVIHFERASAIWAPTRARQSRRRACRCSGSPIRAVVTCAHPSRHRDARARPTRWSFTRLAYRIPAMDRDHRFGRSQQMARGRVLGDRMRDRTRDRTREERQR